MAKTKKALVLFLVFAMFTCSFLSVSAQTPDAAENPPSGTYRPVTTAVAMNSNNVIVESVKIYTAKTGKVESIIIRPL